MRSLLHLASRLILVAFVLLTWAYGVASYSPFAFDMFIKPQLLPALTEFVAWHHLWYWGAYLSIVASLVVEIVRPDSGRGTRTAVRWLAGAFIAVFGLGSIGGMMIMSALVSMPLRLTADRFKRTHRAVQMLAAIFSLGLGVIMVYNSGFLEGLFA